MAAKKEKTQPIEPIPITDEEGRRQALKTTLAAITKEHGAGAIMKLGDNAGMNVTAVPTGSLSLDLALGIGGVPKGRIVEIYGPESSGKTTVALHVVAEVQKTGGIGAFIDAEHALDPIYAKKIGVDINELLVSQPDSGEQALSIAEALLRSGAVDVIVIDSVAALVPQAEIDGDMGQAHVGIQARLMSQALRKLAGTIARSNCVMIFINQLREKVGVMYGNPEVTTGGRALKFYSSVRIEVRKKEVLKKGTEIIGTHVCAKVVKNKVAPPFKVAEFDIIYGKGISRMSELVDIAIELNIIEKNGSWFSFNGERVAQGKDKCRVYVEEHPDVAAYIEEKIRENRDLLSELLSDNAASENDEEGEEDNSELPSGEEQ